LLVRIAEMLLDSFAESLDAAPKFLLVVGGDQLVILVLRVT
jgi:hypothetical protein